MVTRSGWINQETVRIVEKLDLNKKNRKNGVHVQDSPLRKQTELQYVHVQDGKI